MTEKQGWGCLVLVGLVVARLSLSSGDGSGSKETGPPRPLHDRFNAKVDCEDFVKQRLETPLTAKFPSIREVAVSGNGSGPWTVNGYVDAQNMFGAMVRTRYACMISYEGSLVRLEGLTLPFP